MHYAQATVGVWILSILQSNDFGELTENYDSRPIVIYIRGVVIIFGKFTKIIGLHG